MGRLKSKARCGHIINAAIELFVAKGYAKTGLNDIIKKSGGSLSTLYDNFVSKEGLLKAIIESKAEKFSKNITKMLKEKKDSSLEEFLFLFAKEFVLTMKNKKILQLMYVVLQESRNKHVAKIFCESAMKPVFEILISFLKQPHIASRLNTDDYTLLAFRFFNLIEEPIRTWGVAYSMLTKQKIIKQDEAWINNAISFFINGATKA